MFRAHRFSAALALALAATFAATGCGSSTSPSNGSSTDAKVTIVDLVVGTGAAATSGKSVTVNYTAWFYDAAKPDGKGAPFDSNAGGSPYPFVVGSGSVIAGFDQGVTGMKAGGQRRVTIPPELAYGTATLVFDITLLTVS